MWPLLGLMLLGYVPTQLPDVGNPKPEFKIEVHIVEFKPIEGITKKTSDPELYLHIKPALVVTRADVVSVQKRRLRGPTIGTKETGFKHYPGLEVDVQLTNDAKRRIKEAVIKARYATTSRTPIVGIVINDKYNGSWTKFFLHDPSLSRSYWENFGLRIGCTSDKEKAD